MTQFDFGTPATSNYWNGLSVWTDEYGSSRDKNMEAVLEVEWLESLAAQLLRRSMAIKTQGKEEEATAMLITLKEASQWAKETLNIEVTAATLRSACVDKRLTAVQENCSTGRRGQPCEWKVDQLNLAAFLTGKFRSRRKRSAKEVVSAEPALEPAVAAVAAAPAQPLAPAVPAPVMTPEQPEALPVLRPRYKVLELVLQPTLVDFERHDIYNMRVIKKNIPRHATAEKLAIEFAMQAGRSHRSHQLRYVVVEYQSQPRRK
jgi:hypothetical protein